MSVVSSLALIALGSAVVTKKPALLLAVPLAGVPGSIAAPVSSLPPVLPW